MAPLDFSNTGFDFGLKPKVILIGDMQFANYFQEAKCIGLSYAFDRDPMLVGALPINLFFMFENEQPAVKFFESLLRWIENSDNDPEAVEMTFFEEKDGGYTLAISQEVERFMKRMIPAHLTDRVTPVMMLQTQYKKIDVLGRNYTLFKNKFRESSSIGVGYAIVKRDGSGNYSKRSFPKKEFHFYPGSAVNFNVASKTYEVMTRPDRYEKAKRIPKDTLEEIRQRRHKELKSLMPLTNHRLNNQWLRDVKDHFENKYQTDVVCQAICNLLLFERIKRDATWAEKLAQPHERHGHLLLEFLLTTHESFDSYFPADDFFDVQKVDSQMKLDRKELEDYLKEEES